MYTLARNNQIAGTDSAENTFAGDWEPCVWIEIPAAGQDNEFTDGAKAGKVPGLFLPESRFIKDPEQDQKGEDESQDGEKVA